MKLYATLKNERGGKKSTSDDTRILVELTYKNKVIGTVGLYSVIDKGQDIGYRVVWSDERGFDSDNTIREEIKSTCNGKHESVQAIIDCPICKNDPLLN